MTKMQQRRGTAAQWTTAATVLLAGEIGFETDTGKFKIGDGTTAWASLAYQSASGAQGIQGTTGIQGANGLQGAMGLQGTTGLQGLTGIQGAVGTPGAMNYVQTKASKQSGVTANGSTIVSLSITTSGYPVKVDATGDWENNSGAGSWVVLAIYRDGTKVGQNVHAESSAASENVPFALTVIDTPSAGTYTYAVKIVNAAVSGGTFNWGETEGPVLTAIELSGAMGNTGTQGLTGTQGFTGLQGTTGASIQGTQGIQGHDGLQGYSGFVGLDGMQGTTGSQGLTGTQGTEGVQGATGAQGLVGTQGITGTQGLDGIQGLQGLIGIQGVPGLLSTTINDVSITGTGDFKVPGAYYYTSNTGGTQSTSWVISLQGTNPPAQNPDGSTFGVGDIWISWA